MIQKPDTYTSNESLWNSKSESEKKGPLMTGLAYGVGTQLANVSIQGLQNSALHPHVENQPIRQPLKESSSTNTPIFSSNSNKTKEDPCRKEMDKLNMCMQQNDQNMDKCQNQISSFKTCRKDNY